MTPEQHQRAEQLFERVRGLPRMDWAAFLEKHCDDDPIVHADVQARLAQGEVPTELAGAPGASAANPNPAVDAPYAKHDDRLDRLEDDLVHLARQAGRPVTDALDPLKEAQIGPYKLRERIGEGGMGVVYLAEQTEPIRRRVALKLIKLGMDTKQVIARFEIERQALALMNHPNVAKVLDAGATEKGRPYFVMEYVKGESITASCDRHRLTTKERLELFMQVCQAVQHAHQKGIIHRDIKPSNVLVAMEGDKPVPKVIDFGVAKATQHRLTERTLFTEQGQLIGTPEYMSPEQAEMSALDIDTRTDIYSLGVLLYELLVGALPFDRDTLRRVAQGDVFRVIRDTEPPTPSTRLSGLRDEASEFAKCRRVDLRGLIHQLRGDLDWIVMKAIAKERSRRYETANAFAEDIERHLKNEPVLARPPNTSYRFAKFVRRNRLAVAAVGSVILALAVGLSISVVERARAENEAETSRQLMILVRKMFMGADPDAPGGKNVTVREVLDLAAKGIHLQFLDRPLVQATLRYTIGEVYRSLGLYDVALGHALHAFEIRAQMLGPNDVDTVASQVSVGELRFRTGDLEEAERLLRSALINAQMSGAAAEEWSAVASNCLGNLLGDRGDYEEAEQLLRASLAIRRRLFGKKHTLVAETLQNLAVTVAGAGRHEQALSLYMDALSMSGELVEEGQQRYGNPERILRQIQEIKDKYIAEHPRQVAAILSNVAVTLGDHQGVYQPVLSLLRESLAIRRNSFGDESREVAQSLTNLASVLVRNREFSKAEPLVQEALAIRRKIYGDEHVATANTLNTLAMVLCRTGKCVDAEEAVHESLRVFEAKHGREASTTLTVLDTLGTVLLSCRRFSDAEPILLKSYDGLKDRPNVPPSIKREVLAHIVELYESWDSAEPGKGYAAKATAFKVLLE